MRIAITQKKRSWSGQSKHVMELAKGLRERGHEVLLISTPGSEFTGRARAEGFSPFELRVDGNFQFGAVWRMARLLRAHQVDLVHCHDSREHQIACLAARMGRAKTLVRTKHNTLPLRNFASRLIYGPLSSHLIGVSNAVRDILVGGGMPPSHVSVVHNFMDVEEFRPRPNPALKRRLGIPQDAPVVGTVGRLHISKGVEEMLRAVPMVVQSVPEALFLFVGGRHEQWQRPVRRLAVEGRCTFTGRVQNVADYLNVMDVAMFASHHEAIGLSILEAAAAERGIVATGVGGVPEVICEGETGLLVEPHSPEQLARAVVRLLEDEALRRGLAAAARRRVQQKFSRRSFLDNTLRVYERALDG